MAPAEPGTGNENSLDMRLPNPVPSKLLQRLRRGMEGSVLALVQSLPGYLQVDVAGRIEEVTQVALSELLKATPAASHLVGFPLPGPPAQALIEFGPDFLGPALEVLLGALPAEAPTRRGPLTEIEIQILSELFQLVAANFAGGWTGGFDPLPEVPVSAVDPADLMAEEAGDSAVVFAIKVSLAEIPGTIRVAFPSLAVRLLSPQPDGQTEQAELPSSRECLAEILAPASLALEVLLPQSTIRMRDLMDLKQGQILALAFDPHAGVDCTVNGLPKFRGQVVTRGPRIGLEIEEVLPASAAAR